VIPVVVGSNPISHPIFYLYYLSSLELGDSQTNFCSKLEPLSFFYDLSYSKN